MAQNKKVEIRIDAETKAQVQKILKITGMKMSEAIRIYFKKIIITNSIPFEIKTRSISPMEFPSDRLLSYEEMMKYLNSLPDVE